MATKSERHAILDYLESEFCQDLSIHLYSTLLLHQIDPNFPRRDWSSWPLPISEVPDPHTNFSYSDLDQKYDGATMISEIFSEGETGSPEKNYVEDHELNFTNKIKSVSFKERASNPITNLLHEVRSQVEHQIHAQLSLRQLTPSIDTAGSVIEEISSRIVIRIDKLFDEIFHLTERSMLNELAKRRFARLLNWQDVLIAGVACHEEINTMRARQLYDKCEKLFHNVPYKYQYEDSDSFVLEEYLHSLEEANSFNASYKNFKNEFFRRKGNAKHYRDLKKNAFIQSLNNHDSLQFLSINGQQKKRKRFSVNSDEDPKKIALEHGGCNLDEQDYIL